MEEPEVRIAKTESLFRDVNERIAESTQRLEPGGAAFVCECADPDCTEQVEAPLGVYEEVRSDGAQFLLAPGHEDERIKRASAPARPELAAV